MLEKGPASSWTEAVRPGNLTVLLYSGKPLVKKKKIENLETLKVRKPSPIKLLPFSLYLAMEKLSPVGTSLAKQGK